LEAPRNSAIKLTQNNGISDHICHQELSKSGSIESRLAHGNITETDNKNLYVPPTAYITNFANHFEYYIFKEYAILNVGDEIPKSFTVDAPQDFWLSAIRRT
jgi:hypothetical protein